MHTPHGTAIPTAHGGSMTHAKDRETVAVSKELLANAREMAWLLGYSKDDLGQLIEEYAWTIADALADIRSDLEYRSWNNEQECRQVAARVAERLEPDTALRVGRAGGKWILRFFQKESPRLYLWDEIHRAE
jgi:hypothetical protein